MTINEFAATLSASEDNLVEAVKELSLEENMGAILETGDDKAIVWDEW